MTTAEAARRWKETWERAWPAGDVDAIASLYAPDAVYRALSFREPDRGTAGVRRYLEANVAAEAEVECHFGEPVVDGNRAAVEWWGSWVESGAPVTLAGATLLRFDADGLVVDHRDYWNDVPRHEPPYDGWLTED
jgi:ketosteroid isomerase-like protein